MKKNLLLIVAAHICSFPSRKTESDIILHCHPLFGHSLEFRNPIFSVQDYTSLQKMHDLSQSIQLHYSLPLSKKPQYLRRKMLYR